MLQKGGKVPSKTIPIGSSTRNLQARGGSGENANIDAGMLKQDHLASCFLRKASTMSFWTLAMTGACDLYSIENSPLP